MKRRLGHHGTVVARGAPPLFTRSPSGDGAQTGRPAVMEIIGPDLHQRESPLAINADDGTITDRASRRAGAVERDDAHRAAARRAREGVDFEDRGGRRRRAAAGAPPTGGTPPWGPPVERGRSQAAHRPRPTRPDAARAGGSHTRRRTAWSRAPCPNKFHVYDKRTGKLLRATTLPAAGNATRSLYIVNGREYVVIARGGGKNDAPSGERTWRLPCR